MNQKKEKVIYIPADDALHARVKLAAGLVAEGNMSRLAREALNEKLERLAKKYPQHSEELAPAA